MQLNRFLRPLKYWGSLLWHCLHIHRAGHVDPNILISILIDVCNIFISQLPQLVLKWVQIKLYNNTWRWISGKCKIVQTQSVIIKLITVNQTYMFQQSKTYILLSKLDSHTSMYKIKWRISWFHEYLDPLRKFLWR